MKEFKITIFYCEEGVYGQYDRNNDKSIKWGTGIKSKQTGFSGSKETKTLDEILLFIKKEIENE
jgi:hypothetical protein